MSNTIDQIEIKFQNGAPLWVYLQELIPLAAPDGTIVSYSPNRIPIEPTDPRVQEYLGVVTASAIAEAQRQTAIAEDAKAGRDAALARVDNLEYQISSLSADNAMLRAVANSKDARIAELQAMVDTLKADA